ncbi:MAG: hypothetical protein ACLQOO_17750 [Terriglobia bacterium]
MGELLAFCRKRFLDEIRRDDLLGFVGHLRKQRLGDRTVANRLASVTCFPAPTRPRHYRVAAGTTICPSTTKR